jgi:hypothetical protein
LKTAIYSGELTSLLASLMLSRFHVLKVGFELESAGIENAFNAAHYGRLPPI